VNTELENVSQRVINNINYIWMGSSENRSLSKLKLADYLKT
jgi:hypothetical protein